MYRSQMFFWEKYSCSFLWCCHMFFVIGGHIVIAHDKCNFAYSFKNTSSRSMFTLNCKEIMSWNTSCDGYLMQPPDLFTWDWTKQQMTFMLSEKMRRCRGRSGYWRKMHQPGSDGNAVEERAGVPLDWSHCKTFPKHFICNTFIAKLLLRHCFRRTL